MGRGACDSGPPHPSGSERVPEQKRFCETPTAVDDDDDDVDSDLLCDDDEVDDVGGFVPPLDCGHSLTSDSWLGR